MSWRLLEGHLDGGACLPEASERVLLGTCTLPRARHMTPGKMALALPMRPTSVVPPFAIPHCACPYPLRGDADVCARLRISSQCPKPPAPRGIGPKWGPRCQTRGAAASLRVSASLITERHTVRGPMPNGTWPLPGTGGTVGSASLQNQKNCPTKDFDPKQHFRSAMPLCRPFALGECPWDLSPHPLPRPLLKDPAGGGLA